MGEWKEGKLSDYIILGNGKERPRTSGSIPVFGGNGILGYCDKFNYSEETIIIGRVGAYCGSVFFMKEPVWISDNALAAKSKTGNDAKFLYYFLKQLNLNSFAEGSSHPLITQTLLNSIEVSIPGDIVTQTAIAEVLSSLDNKIDLLHRQNKTLEQIAETLFRQWFVEEAEEGGPGVLGDVLELLYGKGLKEEERTGVGFPVVGSSGIVGYHSNSIVKGPGIVIGRKGTLGKVHYMFEDFYPIDTTYYVRPKFEGGNLYYEYFLLKTMNFEDLNTDSAVPGLNRELALASEIVLPSQERILEFNVQCRNIFEKINSNTTQIRILTQLRDTLLPKLMSGEVKVEL